MIRTSILLPEALNQDLRITAKQEETSITDLMRELLDQALAARRKRQLIRTYEVLERLNGAGSKGLTDVSQKVDEVLYGAKGAWKGMSE